MKNLKMYSVIAFGIALGSCEKEEVSINQKPVKPIETVVSKNINNLNPYSNEGEKFYKFLEYLEPFNSNITNENEPCPIELSETGNSEFSYSIKMRNRMQEFASLENSFILSESEIDESFLYLETHNPNEELETLLSNQLISSDFSMFIKTLNDNISHLNSPDAIISEVESLESSIATDFIGLRSSEIDFALSSLSVIKFSAQYMIDNDLQQFPMAAAGAPCGAAIVGYSAGFVGLCLATGPIGWTVGLIGFASGIWGVADNC